MGSDREVCGLSFGWLEWGGVELFLKGKIANLLFLRSNVCFGL